jgi:hypothetical protein
LSEEAASKQDIAVRAAEPRIHQGYVIETVEEDGVILRRPDTVRPLAAGTIGLVFGRPHGRVFLTVDDAGEVSTTFV